MKDNTYSTRGYQPLRDAVSSGSVRNARRMIDDGHSMHVRDASHNTLLHLAVDPSMMTMLLTKGCALEQVNNAGHTPLQKAVTEDNAVGAQTLIERGANIKVTDYAGDSLIHLATSPGMVLTLAGRKCAIDEEDLAGYTALQNAVLNDKVALAQGLIACGADKNVKDNEGNSLMHLASSPEMVTMLIEKKCSIDVENDHEQTPHDQNKSKAIKDILLAAGKDVLDDKGETALHRAVRAGYLTKVEMLIKAGYYINLENKEKDSPLVIAVDRRNEDMERLLRKHGASTYEAVIPKKMLVRDYRRREKAAIIAKGGVSSLPEDGTLPTVPEVIESRWYLGDGDKKAFKGQAAVMYQEPLLRPMMQLVALAGLGEHDNGRAHGKQYKIIGVNAKDIRPLRVTTDSWGLYTNQNSGFAALTEQTNQAVLGTILHESMHFVMTEVFKNGCKPYTQSDRRAKKVMNGIEQAIKDRLGSMQHDKPHEKIAFNSINSVFGEGYSSGQYTNELIARVPDIIGELGVKKGMAWLTKNVPELMEFFENHINPAICEYLRAHKAADFVDIGKPPRAKRKREKDVDPVLEKDKGASKEPKKEEALPASGTPQQGFVGRLLRERAGRQMSISAMEA